VVSNAFGCESRTAFSIPFSDFVRPRITSLNSPIFCNGGQATLEHDVADTTGLDLAWYRDSTLIAENVDSVTVNTTGYYRLEVTELSTGCVLESDLFLICESCDPNPDSTVVVCPLFGGGSPNEGQSCDPSLGDLMTSVNYLGGRCDQIQLIINDPDVVSGTAVWRVDLESGPQLFFGDTVSFPASQNGEFTVYNSALGINSMGDTTVFCPHPTIVEVPGTLDATSSLACLGDSTVFSPNVKLIASAFITNVEWNFGDGAPGSQSSEVMPSFRYAVADSFSATIEIETSAGCNLFDTLDVVVFPNPSASWLGDSIACANDRYEVEALGNAEFYDWRFGNPLPDSAQAIGPRASYSYDSAGAYDIQLTVEDLLGCTQDSLQTVVFNAYAGGDSITVQPDLPACAGDWVDLSVPGTFANLLWSTGSTDLQITADRPGPYSVQVTDNNGCQSEIGPIDIDYEPSPDVFIRANTLQGGGRYSGDTLEVCQGQALEIRLISSFEDYTLSWSVGGNVPTLRYDGITAPILNEGLYPFELTVTDTLTNCTASDEVFVLVHPQPDIPMLTSGQSPPYCSGDMVEIRVDNPQMNVSYNWNTGESGESIIANAAQAYSVTGINAFGCEAESANFFIHPLPDVSFFPLGCYQECGQAEICLPLSSDSRILEWRRNGQLENPPTDLTQVNIDSSGTYTAVIENSFGCQQQTDSIRFDIFYDAGEVSGFVFLDRNNDNLFNMGDSLLSGLPIQLILNGLTTDTAGTDSFGEYVFEDVAFGDYRIELDTSTLPVNWNVVIGVDSVQVSDCGQLVEVPAFVLQECPPVMDSTALTACRGDSIVLDGISYLTDTVVELVEIIGECPEITIYDLQFLPGGDTTQISRMACVGDTLEVLGTDYFTDTTVYESLTNVFGCDSTVAFSLTFESEFRVDSVIQICSGDSIRVDGNWYQQDTTFSYVGQLPNLNCDVRFFIELIVKADWGVSTSTAAACPSSMDGQLQISLANRTLSELEIVRVGGIDSIQLDWSNLAAGSYELELQDTLGCNYLDTIVIDSRMPIQIEVPEVEIPCEGTAVDFVAEYLAGDSSGLSLQWQDGTRGPRLSVSEPGTYTLQVRTACEDFEILARARPEPDSTEVQHFVPNVFSPNQDGLNDEFLPSFSDVGAISDFQLQIFDRWGKLCFESRDPQIGWDGYVQDRLMGTGVYVWRMEWRATSCEGAAFFEESGSVTLVR